MCAAVSASQDGCTNTPHPREAISYCEGTTVHILHGERICPPLVLVAIMLVIASFQLNATMLSPAIGDMATRLGTNAGVIGWSSMLFLSVAAGLAIFFPPLADKIGRRTSLLISVAFMVIGTVLVIVSDSVWFSPGFLWCYVCVGKSYSAHHFTREKVWVLSGACGGYQFRCCGYRYACRRTYR